MSGNSLAEYLLPSVLIVIVMIAILNLFNKALPIWMADTVGGKSIGAKVVVPPMGKLRDKVAFTPAPGIDGGTGKLPPECLMATACIDDPGSIIKPPVETSGGLGDGDEVGNSPPLPRPILSGRLPRCDEGGGQSGAQDAGLPPEVGYDPSTFDQKGVFEIDEDGKVIREIDDNEPIEIGEKSGC